MTYVSEGNCIDNQEKTDSIKPLLCSRGSEDLDSDLRTHCTSHCCS